MEIKVDQLKAMLSNFDDEAILTINDESGYFEDSKPVINVVQITSGYGRKEVVFQLEK